MNSTDSDKKLPKWSLWMILIVFSLGLTLILAEVAVRLIPGQWSNGFPHVHDPVLGTWHLSDYQTDNVQLDYKVKNSFNQFGMRDEARNIEKPEKVKRVAFLGDSFIEGLQVEDNEVLTQKMEEILGEGVEVLNFGVGGFGTYQEYLTYKEKVRQFKPDLVVLGFLSANDMRNNSLELETLYNSGTRPEKPFLIKKDDRTWQHDLTPAKESAQNPAVLFMKRHFTLYRFLWFAKQRFSQAPAPASGVPSGQSINSYLSGLSAPPEGEDFELAWETTEHVIEKLGGEVKADGAQFLLVLLPSAHHMEEDPRKVLEKEYGSPLAASYDVDYPERRLENFARSKNLAYLNLVPAFRSYRDEQKLRPPYFAYEHDGHWSPLGHELAAELVSQHISSNNLLSK